MTFLGPQPCIMKKYNMLLKQDILFNITYVCMPSNTCLYIHMCLYIVVVCSNTFVLDVSLPCYCHTSHVFVPNTLQHRHDTLYLYHKMNFEVSWGNTCCSSSPHDEII